jgi:hypothetical protein
MYLMLNRCLIWIAFICNKIFTLKTIIIKNVLLLFISSFLLILMSCSKNVELPIDKLNDELIQIKMKSSIAEALLDSTNYTLSIESIVPNKYSIYAADIYDSSMKENQAAILKSTDSNEFDLKTYLTEQPKPTCFETSMSELEKSIFVSIIQSLNDKTLIEALIVLNSIKEFIQVNICDSGQQDRLLYIIGAIEIGYIKSVDVNKLKSGKLNLNNKGQALQGEQFDNCYDDCMNARYSNMNLIDWI